MKSNCKSLYLSIIICSFALILIIILTAFSIMCECKILDVFLNIFIGIFSSGLLSFLLLIPSYKVSKAKLLNAYCDEFYRLIQVFDKVSYLFIEYDSKTLVGYINELNNKEFFEKNVNNINTRISGEESQLKSKLIEQYINSHCKNIQNIEKLKKNKKIEKLVDNDVRDIRKKLKLICKEYIEISKEDPIKLDRMLGEMQFFTGKKKYERINNLTYDRMFKAFNEVNNSTYHINSFIDGHVGESVALSEVIKLQSFLYDVKIEEDDDSKTYYINQKFVSDMMKQLEIFSRNKTKEKQVGFMQYITTFKSDINYFNKL